VIAGGLLRGELAVGRLSGYERVARGSARNGCPEVVRSGILFHVKVRTFSRGWFLLGVHLLAVLKALPYKKQAPT
jgi:hypothetical protein